MKKLTLLALCFCALSACQATDQHLPTIERHYTDTTGDNSICLFYPEITANWANAAEVNALIKNEILAILDERPEGEGWLHMGLFSDVKALNDRLISVYCSGRGLDSTSYFDPVSAITVDIANKQILALNDVVTDFDALTDLLTGGKFEGETQYADDETSIWHLKNETPEQLRARLDFPDTHWYTDGSRFVLVFDGEYHCEYAIDIEEVKDIISPRLLECLDGTEPPLSYIEKLFVEEEEHTHIEIVFPEFTEQWEYVAEMNRLFEENAMSTLDRFAGMSEYRTVIFQLDYTVMTETDHLVSVLYQGHGYAGVAGGPGGFAMAKAVTVDVRTAQTISLKDAITDYDTLADLLANGSFQPVMLWECFPSGEIVDEESRDDLREHLEEDSTYWYTNGIDFFLVLDGYYYEIYAIPLEDIKDILSPRLLECLPKGE
ncbi:MAG: hypothetical protein LBR72_04650 [Oscillospiraceae bacterium]|jgi:hypothetical protein|nr:hypothetical protein [Oscillospiraceae bacterium]